MTTGYRDEFTAEAVSRANNIQVDLRDFTRILENARSAEDYHKNAIPFYTGARRHLEALEEEVNAFQSFVSEFGSKLTPDDLATAQAKIESFVEQITAFGDILIVPGLTVAEAEIGTFKGVVTLVEDGDTVFVGERAIRFAGVDAPELGTPAGVAAREFTSSLVLNKEVEFLVDKHNPIEVYGRVLAVPMVGGINVNLELLKNCMAAVNTKFGKHKYVDADQYKQAAEGCIYGWPLVGSAKIISDPTHAMVYIDGNYMGFTPADIRLPIGDRSITLVHVNCTPLKDIIRVDVPKELKVPPYRLSKLATGLGLIEILTDPSGVRVNIDDVPYVSPVYGEFPVDASMAFTVTWSDGTTEGGTVQAMLGEIIRVKVSK